MNEENNEEIKFSDWLKLDLRVGRIVNAEDIEGADKLYKLEVDLGKMGKRTLVAGLKEHYSKENLEGKRCVVFVNLEPKVMKGVKSEGMILAAVSKEEDKEKVKLLQPDSGIEEGSRIM